jgi:hypothetical protein
MPAHSGRYSAQAVFAPFEESKEPPITLCRLPTVRISAASESFNAKIKNFRAQFRGVKDKAFFLFRLAKIYA